MRIFLLCERISGYGGWYTYTRLLRDTLQKNGHEVITCTAKGADGDYAILTSPLDALTKPWHPAMTSQKLKHILDKTKPDVMHITVEPYALLAAFLPKRWRKKTVLTIHGSYGIRPLLQTRTRLQACRYYKRFAEFITVSEYTKDAVIEMLKRKCRGKTCTNFSNHVQVIQNGIELPPWSPKARKTNTDIWNILLVGGAKPRKGVLEALEACAVYKRNYGPDFLFSIIGTCDEREKYVQAVRKRIPELNLTENVRLVGQLSDTELQKAYADADLYLMPSPTGLNTFEGFGLAFLEAAAHGVPSIGPNTSGAREAILHNRSGFQVDVRNAEQIAEHIHQVIDEKRIKPEDCREWAERFGIEGKVREIENIYAKMINVQSPIINEMIKI